MAGGFVRWVTVGDAPRSRTRARGVLTSSYVFVNAHAYRQTPTDTHKKWRNGDMAFFATLALMLGPGTPVTAAAPPVCSPCTYSAGAHRRARRQMRWARWYLRRHRATRPYRAWLARTRACESGGNYSTATGNGYWGAYQFDLSTWASVGGRGNPAAAPPLEQDYRAVVLLRRRGTAPWPICGRG